MKPVKVEWNGTPTIAYPNHNLVGMGCTRGVILTRIPNEFTFPCPGAMAYISHNQAQCLVCGTVQRVVNTDSQMRTRDYSYMAARIEEMRQSFNPPKKKPKKEGKGKR